MTSELEVGTIRSRIKLWLCNYRSKCFITKGKTKSDFFTFYAWNWRTWKKGIICCTSAQWSSPFMSCNTQFVIQFKVKNSQTIALSLKRTAYVPRDKSNFQNSSFNSILSKWVVMMASACKGQYWNLASYFTKLKENEARTSCSSSSHRLNYCFFFSIFRKKD